MRRKLLISGDRADFTTLVFDEDENTLTILADYKAPYNVSWVEHVSSHGDVDCFIGLSEDDEVGLLYSFEVDDVHETCKITSQQPTRGAPAHFVILRDNSAIALATYLGGSVALYPVSGTKNNGILLTDPPCTELLPDFPYASAKTGPVAKRQRQCHIHQVLEDKRGLLYAPDLGSDRVWILRRHHLKLEICGWLQCPPGTGPRHAVWTPDEAIMYVLGELSHSIIAFDLSAAPAEAIQPIGGFEPNIIAPTIHPEHQSMMDSAELCTHPVTPNVLYASNRWARHIAEREPHLKNVSSNLPPGDDIAIVLLSQDGKAVESVKHVSTQVDVIRGMRLTNDGKFAVVLGQEGGGVEVYGIGGDRGDVWTLMASVNEGLERGIKHAVWV